MEEKKTFEKSLRLTKISLFLSGINIYDKKFNTFVDYFVENFLFYLNLLWLYTDVLGELYWLVDGIIVGKSFYELSFVTPCTTVCLLASAKSAPLYINKTTFIKIFKKLRDIHPADVGGETNETRNAEMNRVKISNEEKNIIEESTKHLNFFVFLLFSSAVAVVTVFSFLPLTIMGYHYFKSGHKTIIFPFPAKYYFDSYYIEFLWPCIYFHQVWSTVLAWVNVFGPDTFMYAFCVYMHMHFRILCHRIENLFWSSRRGQIKEKLFELVKRHQELIELVNEIDKLYTKSTLFNILTSSLLICLCLFNITTNKNAGAIIAFVNFLFMSLSQISMLCYFGDLIMRSSMQVNEAVYNCGWTNADEVTKKTLLFVMNRSQRPCRLTAAGFADLNLSAFAKIISRSWSYFALLKTIYD